jgi:hypothetical protein
VQKKTAKKLVLRKETVLRLEELKDVQGGEWWTSTCSNSCVCSFTCSALICYPQTDRQTEQ